ncbi:MAG: hypothetical protein ACK48B_15525 [Dolichospermum sp.]
MSVCRTSLRGRSLYKTSSGVHSIYWFVGIFVSCPLSVVRCPLLVVLCPLFCY